MPLSNQGAHLAHPRFQAALLEDIHHLANGGADGLLPQRIKADLRRYLPICMLLPGIPPPRSGTPRTVAADTTPTATAKRFTAASR
jgi:hypothetical protein